MEIEITHETNADGGRYRLFVDGDEAGELDYEVDADGARDFTHTGVREEHEGQGLAAKLAAKALADARDEGTPVRATCPYVKRYLERHPEERDLLAP